MNLPDIINPDLTVPGEVTKWGYRHMSEEEYRAFPAINNSLLKCPTLAEMYALLTARKWELQPVCLKLLTPRPPHLH